jgi:ribosomal protein S18 acetylase RimI-like enzyme
VHVFFRCARLALLHNVKYAYVAQEAIQLVKSPCVTLHVDPSNEAAVRLYTGLSFQLDGVLEDYYSPGRPAQKFILHIERH